MNEDTQNNWILDKRVPIALIVTLLFQSGVAIWWASGIDRRVAVLEKAIEVSDKQAEQLSDIASSIATLKANGEATKDDVKEVKDDLDTLTRELLKRPEMRQAR